MQMNNEKRSIISSNMESTSFEISSKDAVAIMGLLRDGLYTDKVLAVLREYSANAWDAHRSVGKHELPIKVTIPTDADRTMRIRDFGPGLSHGDVFNVFCKYGASTKRDTDDEVGGFGVGSKSGFAYSDTFTITSWYDGFKRTYVAVLDETDKGKISLMNTTPCGDETGVEISIVVLREDLYDFNSRATDLFRHMTPRPDINIVLPALPADRTVLANGAISGESTYDTGWVAIMGCVPYKINLNQLDSAQVTSCLRNLYGELYFDIGEVQIVGSREELKYSKQTKDKLVAKFNALLDEYTMHALEDLEDPNISGWDKRLRVQVLSNLGLPLPSEYDTMLGGYAKLEYDPAVLTILHGKNLTTRVNVGDRTKFVVDDTGNPLRGYSLGNHDYVVRSATRGKKAKTTQEIEQMLKDVLVASGLDGVPVVMISTCYYRGPKGRTAGGKNAKHTARMFQLDTSRKSFRTTTMSNNWLLTEERTATAQDVYVLIEGFEAYNGFFGDYQSDRMLAEQLGVDMPPIYGYKDTTKKPANNVVGIEYLVWRKQFVEDCKNLPKAEELRKEWEAGLWSKFTIYSADEDDLAEVSGDLGADHPLVAALVASRVSTSSQIVHCARALGFSDEQAPAQLAMDALGDKYPLLKDNWCKMWDQWRADRQEADWRNYVKMVDDLHRLKALDTDTATT